MALPCGRVVTSTIQLVGRWHSGVMLRYLHRPASTQMSNLCNTRLRTLAFHLVLGHEVAVAAPLLVEVPAFFD